MCAQLLSRVLLFPTPWTVAHQAPPVHGVSQARTLEWAAISFSRGSSQPSDQTRVSYVSSLAGGSLPPSHLGSPKHISTQILTSKHHSPLKQKRNLTSPRLRQERCKRSPKHLSMQQGAKCSKLQLGGVPSDRIQNHQASEWIMPGMLS